MILIKNRIRKIKINEKKIKAGIKKMLAFLSYEDFDIGLLCTTNETIRHYNKTFRHKDKATDILSFPYHTELTAGERIAVLDPEDKNLGDLIVSLEFAAKDAKEREWKLNDYILMLIAHGIAHLLGHDHIQDDDYEKMKKLESSLFQDFHT
jgi:probable rRNA maturation factor